MRITIGGFYFKYPITQFKYGNIKCTTTKVKYCDLMILASFIQTISQCCGCRLIHDTANIQTCNFTGFFGSLALRIIKISRNGNNRFCYFLAQVIFSGFLHFLKDHGRDFLWRIQSAIYVNTNGIIVTFYYFIAPVADFFCHFIIPAAHKTLNTQ